MKLMNPYKMFQGVFIPNALLRFKGVSQSAKLMWGRLAQYAGEDGRCYPDFGELANEVGLSESGARKVLKELREAKLILVKYPKGVERLMHRRCEYFFLYHEIFQPMTKVFSGVTDNGYPGLPENGECKEYPKTVSATEENHIRESYRNSSLSEQSSDDGSDEFKKVVKKYHGSDDDHRLARKIYESVLVVNATVKEPGWDRWANVIRLMREQDGRSHDEIWRAFSFANRDPFWGNNVLSPDALRRHFAKLAPRAGMVRSQVRGVGTDVGDDVAAGRVCGECEFAGKGKPICGGRDADPQHKACELFRPVEVA